MPDLPPIWYSRLERFLICNKVWIFAALYFLIFMVLPFFLDERLDVELVDGITSEAPILSAGAAPDGSDP